jgi:hypothetical protein
MSDDVVVPDDIAIIGNDEARAQGLSAARTLLSANGEFSLPKRRKKRSSGSPRHSASSLSAVSTVLTQPPLNALDDRREGCGRVDAGGNGDSGRLGERRRMRLVGDSADRCQRRRAEESCTQRFAGGGGCVSDTACSFSKPWDECFRWENENGGWKLTPVCPDHDSCSEFGDRR